MNFFHILININLGWVLNRHPVMEQYNYFLLDELDVVNDLDVVVDVNDVVDVVDYYVDDVDDVNYVVHVIY